jgi:hypothetical protein
VTVTAFPAYSAGGAVALDTDFVGVRRAQHEFFLTADVWRMLAWFFRYLLRDGGWFEVFARIRGVEWCALGSPTPERG